MGCSIVIMSAVDVKMLSAAVKVKLSIVTATTNAVEHGDLHSRVSIYASTFFFYTG